MMPTEHTTGRCMGRKADGHCCWIGGLVCPFLGVDEAAGDEGRYWFCTLRRELGSWNAVYADGRYLAFVQPALRASGIEQDCGDWPPAGTMCHTCGAHG